MLRTLVILSTGLQWRFLRVFSYRWLQDVDRLGAQGLAQCRVPRARLNFACSVHFSTVVGPVQIVLVSLSLFFFPTLLALEQYVYHVGSGA